jgi:hypothetical protein
MRYAQLVTNQHHLQNFDQDLSWELVVQKDIQLVVENAIKFKKYLISY